MAVQNYFTNFSGYLTSAPDAQDTESGTRIHYLQNTVNPGASDSNGSTYLLFKNVPATARIKNLWIENAAQTGGTSYSIGLYNSQTGAAIAANALLNAQDLSSAHTKATQLDGIAALTHAQTKQCLYEIAGDSVGTQGLSHGNTYDIVLTANTAGSSGGNITARMDLLPAG